MSKAKMDDEEKAELLLKVFDLYNSGHLEEVVALAKTIPVEKFVERACGMEC